MLIAGSLFNICFSNNAELRFASYCCKVDVTAREQGVLTRNIFRQRKGHTLI